MDESLRIRRLVALLPALRPIGHDLKNLLSIAMGNLELALPKVEDERVRKDLATSLGALDRMDAILTRAQGLLREGGEEAEDFSLRSLLEEVQSWFGELRPQLLEGLALEVREDPGEVTFLQEELRQFLLTLFALMGGGGLCIHLDRTRLAGREGLVDGDYARLLFQGELSDSQGLWMLSLERALFRAHGGDIQMTPDGPLLLLPLAP
ncbi:MAG TPA: hypothetical protein ENK02_12620 [Planctomycetes bacterium]|nr:hypothetical protein [Planctomycetota bacterium]